MAEIKYSKNFINKLWNSMKKTKYIRINNKNGSMPTFKEFKKIMLD